MKPWSFFFLFTFLISVHAFGQTAPTNGDTNPLLLGVSSFANTETRSRSSKSEETEYIFDLHAGYGLNENIYVGAIFGLDSESSKTSGYTTSTDNRTRTFNRQSYGPSIGYFSQNFFGILSYHYSSTWVVKSTGGVTSDDKYVGSGIQIDLGVVLPLGSFSIGPKLSYKSFVYTKLDGESISPSLTINKLEPSLSVWTSF